MMAMLNPKECSSASETQAPVITEDDIVLVQGTLPAKHIDQRQQTPTELRRDAVS